MLIRTLLFLVINFGALAIGGLFTNKGVSSEWYVNLNKAPWTPPGWVFGAAWTAIMLCFTVYMSVGWSKVSNVKVFAALFTLQWVLNVVWNPVFFHFHQTLLGLIIISALTILIGLIIIKHWPELKLTSLFLAPYFIWLLIATSLNGYILVSN